MIFGIKKNIQYNVLLAIATNIPMLLLTGFVVQGHICKCFFNLKWLALKSLHFQVYRTGLKNDQKGRKIFREFTPQSFEMDVQLKSKLLSFYFLQTKPTGI